MKGRKSTMPATVCDPISQENPWETDPFSNPELMTKPALRE
jgi:hypothetical protein